MIRRIDDLNAASAVDGRKTAGLVRGQPRMELHAQQALTFELRDFWICARSVLSPRLKLPSEWSALVDNFRTYLAFSRKAIGISVETAEPHCEREPKETVADCAER